MVELTQDVLFDSFALNRIFSTIANKSTGLGTSRDKTRAGVEIKYNAHLEQNDLINIYRSAGIARRLVNIYPDECIFDWLELSQVAEPGTPDIDTISIERYFKNLKMGIGKLSLKTAFREASINARLHGDGYILIGIADGRELDEPVDLNNIQSIEWLRVVSTYYCYPDYLYGEETRDEREQIRQRGLERSEEQRYTKSSAYGYYDQRPDFYRVTIDGTFARWHHSRILRFKGNELIDISSLQQTAGCNDSVIQTFFSAWLNWQQGLDSGAAMLSDYSQAVYKMKGLSQLLLADQQTGSTFNQDLIMNRLLMADMGRSVMKATIVDSEEEDFEYANRNYSGADQIMSNHEQALLAAIDMPGYKLFNQTNSVGNALSTPQTAGLAQRYDWTAHKNFWMSKHWVENYEKIVYYAQFIKELGINREFNCDISPNAQVTLTPMEQLQVQDLASDRDTKNIDQGVYTQLTAQQAYLKPKWSPKIEIAEEDIISPANVNPNTP